MDATIPQAQPTPGWKLHPSWATYSGDDWLWYDYGRSCSSSEAMVEYEKEQEERVKLSWKDQRANQVTRNRQKNFKQYTHMRNRRRGGLDEELAEKAGWMPSDYFYTSGLPVPTMTWDRTARPRLKSYDMDQEEWAATAFRRHRTTPCERRIKCEDVEERDRWYGYGMKINERRGVEVQLEDLVVSTRHTRKTKKKECEFEFVPHKRTVVVLEDTKEVPVVDESWEYIDSDNEKVDMPTYAKVAGTVS